MELMLAKSQDALVLTSISKRAFDSDIEVGGTQAGGPPGYQSHKYHLKMAAQKHLFTLDTPLWNIRTNNFYQKLGYEIEKKDKEFAYYIKRTSL